MQVQPKKRERESDGGIDLLASRCQMVSSLETVRCKEMNVVYLVITSSSRHPLRHVMLKMFYFLIHIATPHCCNVSNECGDLFEVWLAARSKGHCTVESRKC